MQDPFIAYLVAGKDKQILVDNTLLVINDELDSPIKYSEGLKRSRVNYDASGVSSTEDSNGLTGELIVVPSSSISAGLTKKASREQ